MRRAWPKQQPPRSHTSADLPEPVKRIVRGRSGGVCEIDACGPATEFHHRRPKASGGTSVLWVNRAANILHLSLRCHLKAEGRLTGSSRVASHRNGWLISHNGRKTAVTSKVLRRGGWVWLDDTGDWRPAPPETSNPPL